MHLQIRANLHVILSMDLLNPKYEIRCQRNPAIHKHCTLLWLEGWSDKGMLEFSNARLYAWNVQNKMELNMGATFLAIHKSIELTSGQAVSPRQYVTFVDEFQSIYKSKGADLTKHMTHLQVHPRIFHHYSSILLTY